MGLHPVPVESYGKALGLVQSGVSHLLIGHCPPHSSEAFQFAEQARQLKLPRYTYMILTVHEDDDAVRQQALTHHVDDVLPLPLQSVSLRLSLLSARRVLGLNKELLAINDELPQVRKALDKELFILRQLQLAMMPAHGQKVDQASVYMYSKPYSVVSGDQCGVFSVDEDTWGFYMVDVVGHGIPAAIRALGFARLFSLEPHQSALFHEREHEHQAPRLRTPGEVLSVLNMAYQTTDEDHAYLCAMYGLFKPASGTLSISLAGMPRPWVLHQDGGVSSIGEPDMPLGLFPDHQYTTQSLTLLPTDQLLMASDGLADVFRAGDEHELLGMENLDAWIRQYPGRHLRTLIQNALFYLQAWAEKPTHQLFSDDVTILGIDLYSQNTQLVSVDVLSDAGQNTPADAPQATAGGASLAGVNPAPSLFNPTYSKALVVFDSDDLFEALAAQLRECGVAVQRVRSNYFMRVGDPILRGVDMVAIECADGTLKGSKWTQLAREFIPDRWVFVMACQGPGEFRQASDLIHLGADTFLQLPCSQRELRFVLQKSAWHIQLLKSLPEQRKQLLQLREEIDQDMQKVARMQRNTLPKPMAQLHNLQMDWVYKPAGYVSGDFIGVFKISKSVVGFFNLDVTEQGVLAAVKGWSLARLLTGLYRDSTSAESTTVDPLSGLGPIRSPSEVLRLLNATVMGFPAAYRFNCSMVYGSLDCETGQGVLSNAGHPDCVIVRQDGYSKMVGSCGPRIGENESETFTDAHFTLQANEQLLMFSDGLSKTLFENDFPMLQAGKTQRLLAELYAQTQAQLSEQIEQRLNNIKPTIARDISMLSIGLSSIPAQCSPAAPVPAQQAKPLPSPRV
ncbi:SpoIIE family protein phosphatase [Limnobacter humi]|uniref:SpoIIE family protein phosphatase n=1 Tax=Limnobacter humi TaxID=1778671 RepID=A0ABT1WJ41_9BURK|nr:SpoIIE family protein phosphatase [Limnobacter humi]MCQ8897536.1 SpoIIE family protein phosphatase [Limnobacter humi]